LNNIYQDKEKCILIKGVNYLCKKALWILTFSQKQTILKYKLDQHFLKAAPQRERHYFTITRKSLLNSAITQFSNKPLKHLRREINVSFDGEQGYDAGGPRAEFLTIITQELFSEKSGLFIATQNSANVQINPLSQIILGHCKYFEFAGMMLAKALQMKSLVDVNLTKSLLKHILKRRLAIDDLEDIDADFTKRLRWMLENSVEGLDQSFTYETKLQEGFETRELIPNGAEIEITDQNKRIFVDKVCEFKMKEEVSKELESFLRGFNTILPTYFFDIFSSSELQILIAGMPTIILEELKKHTSYDGYNSGSDLIKWLWETLEEFSEKERALFIYFGTGSMKISTHTLQSKGFKIKKDTANIKRLPVAHTCFNQIDLAPYTSKEELKDKLILAIYEGKESFGLA